MRYKSEFEIPIRRPERLIEINVERFSRNALKGKNNNARVRPEPLNLNAVTTGRAFRVT